MPVPERKFGQRLLAGFQNDNEDHKKEMAKSQAKNSETHTQIT
jgi:hypothetical protein